MANNVLTTTKIARDVIAGYYGSGEIRKKALEKAGYNYEKIQAEANRLLCSRELIIDNMEAFAKKIAADDRYWYVYWNEKYGHECAVCHPHDGKNHGWQCIGFAWAVWHHAGLPIPCNCGVIDNATMEKILKAKTDAEALKITQQHLGIKDIKVIRNKNGIPKSQAQPGDVAGLFDGLHYQHTYVIMSNDKIADSTQAGGIGSPNNIKANRAFAGRYVSGMKVLIRYIGKGLLPGASKSIDVLAHEVINGMWLSGDRRKRALTEAGYDYNAVQKRVDEILNPTPKPKPQPKPIKKKPYTGKYPVVKKYLEKGDKGSEVVKLQNYLNWYTDGEFFKKCGKADGIYGNNTLKYTKKMQTAFFNKDEADGKVGKKTIAKMKAYSDSFKK